MSASVDIRDTATPELRRIAGMVRRPRMLMQAAGKRVETELHEHFLARDAEGNSQGWKRTHWWNREVKKATAYQGATDTEATVSIASKQFLHKLRGGRVRAAKGKFLSIPLTNQAKTKGSPGEWTTKGDGQLQFIRSRQGVAYLFPGKGRRHGASYLLLKSVVHKADPDALPRSGKIEAGIDDEAGKYLRRELARGSSTGGQTK
ncbi:MAG: hypothetical protein Fur0032_19300 [Terrimicrobiaceae bacterium]